MKIIEVPVFNEDGSVQMTQLYTPEEAQRLLQFAVNFMLAVGNNADIALHNDAQQEMDFDD